MKFRHYEPKARQSRGEIARFAPLSWRLIITGKIVIWLACLILQKTAHQKAGCHLRFFCWCVADNMDYPLQGRILDIYTHFYMVYTFLVGNKGCLRMGHIVGI